MGHATRVPSAPLPPDQRQALLTLARLLAGRDAPGHRLILIDAEGRQAEVPPATVAALAPAMAAVTARLGEASDPALLPDDAELSTTRAARFLRVSRQYLARLLDRDALPYRMVGSHHRLRVGDLRAYQARQRAAIREAARLSQDLGLYDD
jgi:excisionase family DNA binding protein